MKKYLLMLMASLCAIYSIGQPASKHVLGVGDKAPALRVYRHLKGDSISAFEPGKVYVIEFGATWCSPCRALVPHLSALANKYQTVVNVYSMFVLEPNTESAGTKNYKYITAVKKYVAYQGAKIQYSVGVDDPDGSMQKAWLEAADKTGVPYTFIIDKNGIIAAIAVGAKNIEDNLAALLEGKLSVATAKNISPLKKQFDSTFVYKSSLSHYASGQPVSENGAFVDNYFWTTKDSPYYEHRGIVRATNESLSRLFYMAYGDTLYNIAPSRSLRTGLFPDTIKWPGQRRTYGKYWYKPVFEMKDSSMFDISNRFNYELKLPRPKGTSKNLRSAMQRDLEAVFGFSVTVEERQMPVWYLTVSEQNKARLAAKNPSLPYKSEILEDGSGKFTSAEVRDIVFQLEITYGFMTNLDLKGQPNKQTSFIDATGITGKIDVELGAAYVNAMEDSYKGGPPFTFSQYRDMLKAAGFDLVKGQKKMKVVVIRPPKQ